MVALALIVVALAVMDHVIAKRKQWARVTPFEQYGVSRTYQEFGSKL